MKVLIQIPSRKPNVAYKPIKSSVRKTKSVARRMHEERQRKIKEFQAHSANKTAQKKPTSADKAKTKRIELKDRVVRVVPLKQNAGIVQQLPDTVLTRKGKSLKELLRGTPPLFKHNAKHVIISKLIRKKTKSGLPAVEAIAYSVDPYRPNKTRREHKLYIIGLDSQTTPINKQRRVLVSCPCENYVFTWEYANALHGASKLVYSNGEPPTFTNPGNAVGLCKHCVALAEELVKKNW